MTTAGSSGRRSVERAMTTRHAPCSEIARSGVTRSDEAFTLAQCPRDADFDRIRERTLQTPTRSLRSNIATPRNSTEAGRDQMFRGIIGMLSFYSEGTWLFSGWIGLGFAFVNYLNVPFVPCDFQAHFRS